jgi:hypothetical protein
LNGAVNSNIIIITTVVIILKGWVVELGWGGIEFFKTNPRGCRNF